jgi:hypothetical protein
MPNRLINHLGRFVQPVEDESVEVEQLLLIEVTRPL